MAAYEVAMESGDRAKYRDPGLVILWTILTLGVYNAVWYYKINRELRDFGRARNDEELSAGNPILSLLAVTIGAFVIVPPFVSWWRATKRLQRAQEIAGVEQISGWLILGCVVFGLATAFAWLGAVAFVQDGLNKIWSRYPRATAEPAHAEATTV